MLCLTSWDTGDRLLPSKRPQGRLSCLRCVLGCKTVERSLRHGGGRGTAGGADAMNKAVGTADLPPMWMLSVGCREELPPWTRSW